MNFFLLVCSLFIFFLSIGIGTASAATYYVRKDGGTLSQCNGRTDVPYPGSGTGQACAFNHPFWALPIKGNPSTFQGGDTLIIGPGSYRMGYDAPNQKNPSSCHQTYPWDCHMKPIPSGPDAAHPTRILGKGWDQGCVQPPQLYGVERATMILNLNGSNHVTLQCLDITDHDGCTAGQVPGSCKRSRFPYGEHADVGIKASDSSNVYIKNLRVHGLTYHGIHAGRLRNWTMEDSTLTMNSFSGWNGDIGVDKSSNSGDITFRRVRIVYNGCGENPSTGEPQKCYSQTLGGYGDGLGTHRTGGNWIFENVDISHNTSDGLDLLYHDGNGTITIKKSRFEGNAGNPVKVATTTWIENSLLIGNCAYFNKNPIAHGVDNCRAGGNTLAAKFHAGTNVSIFNSTLVGEGDVMIESSGNACEGKEKIVSVNNIFFGQEEFLSKGDRPALYYAGGKDGNGSGPCRNISFQNSYAVLHNIKGIPLGCQGDHLICQNPLFVGPLKGNKYHVEISTRSPARGKANILPDVSPTDYLGIPRGKSWDVGGLEYQEKGRGVPQRTLPPAEVPQESPSGDLIVM